MLAKWEKCDEVQKKKGLFGEALFLTTSHFEVLVIDNNPLFYAPPFVNPGSTTDTVNASRKGRLQ